MATKNGENLLYEKESYIIRGACFGLYKKFGGVFKETIINKALVYELKDKGLNIENQKRIEIMHRGEKLGTYIPDIIVEKKILIELKVKPFIMKEDDKQFWYYLKASDYKLGFLINFGSRKLEIKRRVYDKAREAFLHKSALISACICFYFIFTGLLFVFSVSAQSGTIDLFISPEIFELQMEKGGVYTGKIKILNRSETPIPLEAITAAFDSVDELGTAGFADDTSAGSAENDLLANPQKWIKIANPNFILDAGETISVNFTVSVPKNAENGGNYAMIFFQPRISAVSQQNSKEISVKILSKVGVPFLVSVGKRDLNATGEILTIAEFGIPDKFHLRKVENSLADIFSLINKAQAKESPIFSIVENAFLPFTLRIKNNDIYHSKPYGKLAIAGGNGKVLGETIIDKTTILPGKTREIPVNFQPEGFLFLKKYLPASVYGFLNRNFIWGKYQARLSMESEKGVIEKEMNFWIFPWKTGIAILIIAVLIVLFRKRIILAGRVLLVKREILNPKS